MKKLLTILLTILMCLSLTACKDNEASEQSVKQEETTQETIVEEDTKKEETTTVEETKDETAEETTQEESTEKSGETDRTNLYYWVNFRNIDGSTLQRTKYKYGSTPTYNGETPTYYDGSYIYTFTGWDKKISTVHMTQIYTAVYSKVAIAKKDSTTQVVNPTPKANLKYDGTAQALITAGSGATFTYSLDGGAYSTTIPTATNAGNYAVEYKKDGVVAGVILVNIAKRNVTVTSGSASKAYDGTPLTNNDLEFTYGGDGLVSGHACGIQNPGKSITNVGSVENTVAVTDVYSASDLLDVTNNYNITCVSGTLKVTKRKVTLYTNSKSKVYDGMPLINTDVSYGALAGGESFVTEPAATGTITNVGQQTNTVDISSLQVKRGSVDTTANYEFSKEEGTLTVTKRPITLTSGSDTKVYDGDALTNPNVADNNKVSGHTIYPTTTGSITNVGTAQNTFTAVIKDTNGVDATDNYDITYVYGTLTITGPDSCVNAYGVAYMWYDQTKNMYYQNVYENGSTLKFGSGSIDKPTNFDGDGWYHVNIFGTIIEKCVYYTSEEDVKNVHNIIMGSN